MHSCLEPLGKILAGRAHPTGGHDTGPWNRPSNCPYKVRSSHLSTWKDLHNLCPKLVRQGDLGNGTTTRYPCYLPAIAHLCHLPINNRRNNEISSSLQINGS